MGGLDIFEHARFQSMIRRAILWEFELIWSTCAVRTCGADMRGGHQVGRHEFVKFHQITCDAFEREIDLARSA